VPPTVAAALGGYNEDADHLALAAGGQGLLQWWSAGPPPPVLCAGAATNLLPAFKLFVC
jgi:hypothetical protein